MKLHTRSNAYRGRSRACLCRGELNSPMVSNVGADPRVRPFPISFFFVITRDNYVTIPCALLSIGYEWLPSPLLPLDGGGQRWG